MGARCGEGLIPIGTRADFYVGRGPEAEWLGSIAWDGDFIDAQIQLATDERSYRAHVATFLAARDDATLPEQGWPWPWIDGRLTDVSYAFDVGKVWTSLFGHAWYPVTDGHPSEDLDAYWDTPEVDFPDMSARKNVALGGKRSGVIVVSRTPEGWDVR